MKIAVAVDGSDNALRAADHAFMLATYLPEAHIEVVFVADYNQTDDELITLEETEELVLKRDHKIHAVLDQAKENNIDVKLVTLKGNPSQEIIKYTNKVSVDQLVLGSRGLNAFQEMILGSVSHKVLKHVNCPVTIVK